MSWGAREGSPPRRATACCWGSLPWQPQEAIVTNKSSAARKILEILALLPDDVARVGEADFSAVGRGVKEAEAIMYALVIH